MKVKDLPENILLKNVIIEMPIDIFKLYKKTGLPTNKVIFVSAFSSSTGYFVKTKETNDRIFPIWLRDPKEILEWKVIQ